MSDPETTITEIIEEELKDKIEVLENRITILEDNIGATIRYTNSIKELFEIAHKNNESITCKVVFAMFDIIIQFLECKKRKIK